MRRLLVLAGLAALLASPVSAATITYRFGGVVYFRSSNLAGVAEVDDSIVVTIKIDRVDTNPDPGSGVYTILNYSVVVDGATLVTAAGGRVFVEDGSENWNNGWYEDTIQLAVNDPSYFTSGPVAGIMPDYSGVDLMSVGPSNPDTIASDALPLVTPDPADFYSSPPCRHSVSVYFANFSPEPEWPEDAYLEGDLVSIVPEPATGGRGLLVLTGALGLAVRWRRTRDLERKGFDRIRHARD